MTDIQRWEIRNPVLGLAGEGYTEVVTYADHVEALRQAEARGKRSAPATCVQAYDEGQRDALARYPFNVHEFRAAVLAEAVQRVEALWGSSWCGLRYATCDDPDHACRYRREVIAAIKGEQA